MITLFISHAPEDAGYAETLRQGLEREGYRCWRAPGYPAPTDYKYPYVLASAIIASPVLILVWSAHAAHDAWVARQLQLAQQLKKAVLPIALDRTSLSSTLVASVTLSGATSHNETLSHLLQHLPARESRETLLTFLEKAGHEFHSSRCAAIELAAAMLARNEYRAEVLAVLQYLAQHDLMTGVREKAQEVLEADKQIPLPVPATVFLDPEDARSMLNVRCKKCQYVTSFDRRRLCSEKRDLKRLSLLSSDSDSDEMELHCGKCGHLMVKHVDCEGL